MKYNLSEVREKYGFTMKAMGEMLGLEQVCYKKYEDIGEIPSKYIYTAWSKDNSFPVPEDFFFYTSFTMEVNMKYHKMTQRQVADAFGIANQTTVSNLMLDNIPMYEKKDTFHEVFSPLIVPRIFMQKQTEDAMTQGSNFYPVEDTFILDDLSDLVPKGNFMLVRKRRKAHG